MTHVHRFRSDFEQVDAHSVDKRCPECLAVQAALAAYEKALERIVALKNKRGAHGDLSYAVAIAETALDRTTTSTHP